MIKFIIKIQMMNLPLHGIGNERLMRFGTEPGDGEKGIIRGIK